MKILRMRYINRAIPVFFLLVFVQSVILPGCIYALTTGPHQQEYTAYEETGSTDMVNLSTGDFTFSLPILEVPGPEGSFSLPLSYHAGIGLEQEASWVGLGWTVNPGAITRSINEFPDDASGESQVVTVKDLTGLRGWDAKIFGIGNFGWNNQVGHFGNLSLLGLVNAQWTEDYSSVGVAGINVTSDGVKADPVQMTIAAVTLISWGAAGAVNASGNIVASELGKQAAIGMAVSMGTDAIFTAARGDGTPSAPKGYWAYSKKEKKILTTLGTYKEYKIWLDKTRTENMFGSLYLGNAPTANYSNDYNVSLALDNAGTAETLQIFKKSTETVNEGAASDINYYPDPNEEIKEFYQVNNPVVLAYDNFHVKGKGITGTINPYRLEMGSVSMPREMTAHHDRLAPVKYLPNNSSADSYKVPFIYAGQATNSYLQHLGGAVAVGGPSDFHFGISTSVTPVSGQNNKLTYVLNDIALKGQRIKTELASLKKVPQANYIEWLTANEIASSLTYPSKYMDFLSGGTGSSVSITSDRYQFRVTPPIGSIMTNSYTNSFNNDLIPVNSAELAKLTANQDKVDIYISYYNSEEDYKNGKTGGYIEAIDQLVEAKTSTAIDVPFVSQYTSALGKHADIQIRIKKSAQTTSTIGGFCITAVDGTTYHYALPVYDYEQNTEIRQITDPNNKKSLIKRNAPFANTWLLTGITGSDFIDRNNNGIIDDDDWGHWIKLNYGLHLSDYKWRLPYESYKKISADHETFTDGKKQLYYLNSIETRSHVALFIKSGRLDGKSASPMNVYPLRLEEIVLVGKEQYKKLTRPAAEGGFDMPQLSNKYNTVLTNATLNSSATTFIKNNCLKRVVFDYGYTLCPGTDNSDAPETGKLTLTRVSIRGRNDIKIVPDYRFEYGYNPMYEKNHYDNWGMYNPNGTDNSFSHVAPDSDLYGTAWSLTKVITPLGGEISVAYERDVYSSVSGHTNLTQTSSFSHPNTDYYYPTQLPIQKLVLSNPTAYSVSEEVFVQGTINYTCPDGVWRSKNFNGYFTITEIGLDYINLGADFTGIGTCNIVNSGEFVHAESFYGTVSKTGSPKKGGNLRVAEIVSRDETGKENKIRYHYKDNSNLETGVVSKEVDGGRMYFYDYPGYPHTPVMYGTVSLLTGKFATASDYDTKQVYKFETPHYNFYTLTQNPIQRDVLISSHTKTIEGTQIEETFKDYLTIYENRFIDQTSSIGRLNSIEVYDGKQSLSASTALQYGPEIINDEGRLHQGFYTGGALMFDRVTRAGVPFDKEHKINRTTVVSYPSVLKKTINTKDGFSSSSENLKWDYLTGMVLEKQNKSPLGVNVKSIIVPAYKKGYTQMGSKTENLSGKNMLSQIAAEYSYRTDNSGNITGLLSASVQTWKNDWVNYRYESGGNYIETPEETESAANRVWRKSSAYVWKGAYARLNGDGSQVFNPGDDFNFSNISANPLWQYTGETVRYDHYSMPLESRDLNNIHSAVKTGYNNQRIVATAGNAMYNEIAFSSAEDENSATGFFGGEVKKKDVSGDATVVRKATGGDAHTGQSALSLSAGYGFIFKPQLTTGKRYKAVVWTNSQNGRLYYKLNGGGEVLSAAPSSSEKVGNWYLLKLEFEVTGTFNSCEAGVKSAGGQVLFDDFRFQPLDAGMTCHVYDPLDFEYLPGQGAKEYALDNDNFYTEFEYNERGLLVKTYQESLKYGVKLISESKDNYRRFHVDQ